MKRSSPVTIVDQFVIPHTAFVNAERQIRQCFAFSGDNAEAEGVAIVGESGAGKDNCLRQLPIELPTHPQQGKLGSADLARPQSLPTQQSRV